MNKDKANMEQKILEAAEKLFMEQGFASTTTAKIAKEAGCNQALVHYYYRTKELLFERIYKEKMQLMVNSITNINTSGSTFEEKVVGVINAHWDFLTKNPLIVWFALRENLNGSTALVNLFIKEIRPKAVDAFSKLEKDLNTEIEKGNISPITIYDLLLPLYRLI
ncbi:TetR/AcrR family transcriptional regulator [Bacteroides caecigallinarum]|uniref:TetR/AcrR family transcriptional regulator n=1 Tax=Bacteroides caecigallinarum TaxID=1411144 RepID=UPI001F4881FF|nr:TetR/AcrR family transcriptional regulator [Bacteroides caecigallinarum]MCF2553485.1 TetR/AcrR family transcriptional regulator [Bacteroides caecigallinarum]